MALSERSRSVLYQGFMSVVEDEQAVQEMMGYFPARDLEEPVTWDFLHAELSGMRTELVEFKSGMRSEMASFKDEMRSEMVSFKDEMRSEMVSFKDEMRAEMASFKDEIRSDMASFKDEMRTELSSQLEAMRTEFRSELHRVFGWNLAAFVSLAAVIVAAVRL